MTWHVHRHIRSIWTDLSGEAIMPHPVIFISDFQLSGRLYIATDTATNSWYSHVPSILKELLYLYNLLHVQLLKYEGVGHSNRPSSYSIGAWDILYLLILWQHIYIHSHHTLLFSPYLTSLLATHSGNTSNSPFSWSSDV